MPHHNNLSESEEMYLVTIRKICESCTDTSIPIPHLAEELAVLPVSVNQMVKKLAEAGFVEYIPYKGVELTAEGPEDLNQNTAAPPIVGSLPGPRAENGAR